VKTSRQAVVTNCLIVTPMIMKRKTIIKKTVFLIVTLVVMALFYHFLGSTIRPKPTDNNLVDTKIYDSVKVAIKRKTVVNLVPFNDNDMYVYRGTDYSNGNVYKRTDSAFKKRLLQIKKAVNDSSFIILIKLDTNATRNNILKVEEEMTINNIKRYALLHTLKPEQKIIDSLRKR
jgi:hypothetical protein